MSPVPCLVGGSPLSLVQSTLQAMASALPQPAFILVTGDLAPHKIHQASKIQQAMQKVSPCARVQVDGLLRESFPSTPILYAIGNNEFYPSYSASDPDPKWLEKLLQGWQLSFDTLPASAQDTFLKGGYYRVNVEDLGRNQTAPNGTAADASLGNTADASMGNASPEPGPIRPSSDGPMKPVASSGSEGTYAQLAAASTSDGTWTSSSWKARVRGAVVEGQGGDEGLRLSAAGAAANEGGHVPMALLILNTVLYSLHDSDITDRDEDPAGQLAWLEAQLASCVAEGRKALIAGHIPPGVASHNMRGSLWRSSFAEKYRQLTTKYGSAIVGHLYGHLHRDQFRIVQSNPPQFLRQLGATLASGGDAPASSDVLDVCDRNVTGGSKASTSTAVAHVAAAAMPQRMPSGRPGRVDTGPGAGINEGIQDGGGGDDLPLEDGVVLIAPSVSPLRDNNPGFRVFHTDEDTSQLTNYDQYATAVADGGEPAWRLEYSATTKYGLESMAARQWACLAKSFVTPTRPADGPSTMSVMSPAQPSTTRAPLSGLDDPSRDVGGDSSLEIPAAVTGYWDAWVTSARQLLRWGRVGSSALGSPATADEGSAEAAHDEGAGYVADDDGSWGDSPGDDLMGTVDYAGDIMAADGGQWGGGTGVQNRRGARRRPLLSPAFREYCSLRGAESHYGMLMDEHRMGDCCMSCPWRARCDIECGTFHHYRACILALRRLVQGPGDATRAMDE
eukprot:jgi/Mesvir1/3073/Mv12055-RA.1